MMKFDITHGPAGQTVAGTNTCVDDVEANLGSVSRASESIRSALPHSAVVSSAVHGLQAEVLDRTGDAVVNHARSATSAASEGLGHYSTGDQEMAQNSSTRESGVGRPDAPGVPKR